MHLSTISCLALMSYDIITVPPPARPTPPRPFHACTLSPAQRHPLSSRPTRPTPAPRHAPPRPAATPAWRHAPCARRHAPGPLGHAPDSRPTRPTPAPPHTPAPPGHAPNSSISACRSSSSLSSRDQSPHTPDFPSQHLTLISSSTQALNSSSQLKHLRGTTSEVHV